MQWGMMRSSPDMAGSSVPCTHGVGQLVTEAVALERRGIEIPCGMAVGKDACGVRTRCLSWKPELQVLPEKDQMETTGWESPSQGSAGISLGPRLPAGGRGWMATVDSASVDCEGKALALQSQSTPASLRD